ncbi:MAG TPA: hypothetical protein PK010_03285, partial [Alphaproteobacteria bacterium]|nr:hypothetical protein [Alphaproteobacteria bacterium]
EELMEYEAVDMKIESVRDSMEGSFSDGENNKAVKIAQKMIKKKMDIETIIEFTELPQEKIEQLIKEEENPEDE